MSFDPTAFRGLGTLALHAGQVPDPTTTARAVPIYATTSYVFHDTEHAANLFGLREFGNIYTRLMNPTTDVLEKRLAALDGGAAALAFASGQAAITAALLTIVHAGQNFISATSLYGGTWTLFTQTLAKLGIEVRFFDPSKPETIHDLVDENTRAVYLETPGNPKNDVPDYRQITDIAHQHGLPTIIDNTVLTPALFRPIEHGFDIVVYSTTKFIGGHGVHLGGAIVDSGKFAWAKDPAKWPEFTAPDPAYHGLIFEEALRPIGNIAYIIHIRTHWLARHGWLPEPVRRVPDSAGSGDAASADGTAFPERAGRGGVSFETSRRAVGELSGAAGPSGPRQREEIPARRHRGDRRLRDQGRQGGRWQADQQRAAVQPPGQYRGREVPDHSSGHDNAFAAHAGGTGAAPESRPSSCACRWASRTCVI